MPVTMYFLIYIVWLVYMIIIIIISDDVVLDWNPLFSVVKVTPDNSEYLVSNTVTVTVSLLYHGQKVGIHNIIYGEIFKGPKISRFHCNLAELKNFNPQKEAVA